MATCEKQVSISKVGVEHVFVLRRLSNIKAQKGAIG